MVRGHLFGFLLLSGIPRMLVIELPMGRERDLREWMGLVGRRNDDLLRQWTSCGST